MSKPWGRLQQIFVAFSENLNLNNWAFWFFLHVLTWVFKFFIHVFLIWVSFKNRSRFFKISKLMQRYWTYSVSFFCQTSWLWATASITSATSASTILGTFTKFNIWIVSFWPCLTTQVWFFDKPSRLNSFQTHIWQELIEQEKSKLLHKICINLTKDWNSF